MRLRLPALGVVVLLIAGLLGTVPAVAAPSAPAGLTPSGTAVSATPSLEWAGIAGATSYQVQASASSSFSPLLVDESTNNRRYVPNRQLPAGEIYWRVRARDSSGYGPWAMTSFTRNTVAAPALISPADAASLAQPSAATLLSWTPVNGVTGYTVQFDDDDTFITPTSTVTTKGSTYLLSSPQTKTDYYWRVRAEFGSGLSSTYSEIRRFRILALTKPTGESPVDDPDGVNPGIQDVVLSWNPVVGAKSYELRVSTDINFAADGFTATTVTNRYSPATTLNNDQYYWQVRPVDALGNKPDWAEVDAWVFKRAWPHQAVQQYPADGSTIGNPVFYQWKPIKHASKYQLQLSTDPTFATPYDSCTSVHTTFIPTADGDCWPKTNVTTYWRIRGYDYPNTDPVVSNLLVAPVSSFTYSPAKVTLTSPLSGSVQVPTFRWQPLAGGKYYTLKVWRVSDGVLVINKATYATSYTHTAALPSGVAYRWDVQATSESDLVSPAREAADMPSFTLDPQDAASSPTPTLLSPSNTSVTPRMPSLTWAPVTGATSYRVYLRAPGGTWPAEASETVATVYPAHTLTGFYNPGGYDWYVAAYDGSTKLSDTLASYRSFTIFRDRTVTGQSISVTGLGLGSPTTSCDNDLTDPTPQCDNISVTPTFAWNPDPEASSYSITFSRDREMTNVIDTYTTESSYWTPTGTFADSQAGEAYHWLVQACKPTCPGVTAATHAFAKLSNPAKPLTPAAGDVVSDAVTFTWQDWALTNELHNDPLVGIPTQLEAHTYGIQVATEPTFTDVIDSATVDQMTYTGLGESYPEGPLYWRVRAIDGSGRAARWSAGVQFTKTSPVPVLTSPLNGQVVPGTQPLRWQPTAFASSYKVQVFKNGDTTGQAANLVVNTTSKQAAYASTSPLPTSGNPYVWRVQRVDSGGNVTDWSRLDNPAARFNVSAPAPTQATPGPGVAVPSAESYFGWTAVDGATSYKFERRAAGATSSAESVTTPALAWAPVGKLSAGSYEWRVSSLDSNGAVMGSSPWRGFSVGTPPTTTTPPPTTTTPPPTTDKTAPKVSSLSPPDGAKVKKDVNFKSVFSEKVKNVTTKTFKLKQKGKAGKIDAKVTLSSDAKTAKLNPKKDLKRGKTYIVKLTSGITDLKGNALPVKKWKVKVT